MSAAALERLLALQHPSGCFPSTVARGERRLPDWNGFVTATVLRALHHLPDSPALASLRNRALDFLSSCRSARVPEAFGFWPEEHRPAWAQAVPPDADDTAMMTTELLRYGRLDRPAALQSVCRLIASCRVTGAGPGRPSWVTPGSFATWIPTAPSARGSVNVVDCCVNTNIVALMAQTDARELPGYEEAIRTVLGGLDWAGADKRMLRSLTPFYPSPSSLLHAIEHAIECGAQALRQAAIQLRSNGAGRWESDAGYCSGAYGSTVWHCEAIDVALRAMPLTC